MKKFIIILSMLIGLLGACFYIWSGLSSNVHIKNISDGDTLNIEKDGIKLKIRLAEIDCPEKDQPYGIEARDFVEKFIEGKTITITPIKTDRYGRTLAHVRANNDDLGEALIKNGYAWVYRQYSKNKKLIELEDKAKKEKVGLWKDANPIAPWTWRKQHK
jgi:endonuclease YncB( thermonuclease family)